jgi:hypothetical protein
MAEQPRSRRGRIVAVAADDPRQRDHVRRPAPGRSTVTVRCDTLRSHPRRSPQRRVDQRQERRRRPLRRRPPTKSASAYVLVLAFLDEQASWRSARRQRPVEERLQVRLRSSAALYAISPAHVLPRPHPPLQQRRPHPVRPLVRRPAPGGLPPSRFRRGRGEQGCGLFSPSRWRLASRSPARHADRSARRRSAPSCWPCATARLLQGPVARGELRRRAT